MGLTINDIKNPVNKPIVFVKIHFYDLLTSTNSSLLFSDFSKSFSDGTDPIVALSAIPFFAKEIDPIESNTIIKSGYKITLNNADGALTQLFKNKVFNGQKVEIYATTENSSDEELIVTGIYSSITVDENIVLTVAEVVDLTKKNTLNLFVGGKNDGNKIPVYKGENIIKTIPTNELGDDWVDTGLNGTIKRKPSTSWFRLYLDNFEDLNRLRSNLFDGDKVIIEGYENDYEFSLASSLLEDDSTFGTTYEQNYVNLKIEKGELDNWLSYDPSPSTGAPGNIFEATGNILIKADDGLNYNDEFLVTDDCDSIYEEASVVNAPALVGKSILKNDDNTYTATLNSNHGIKEYTADNQWVEIDGDWNWLKADERVQVLLQQNVAGVWKDYTEEEMVVDHWDATNSRIYFTDQLSHKLRDNYNQTNWQALVRFYKVQKIAVNDLGDIEIKKNYFDIKINDLTTLENFPFKNNSVTAETTHPLIPYLKFKPKANCMQILANLARINRRDPESLIMSYSQVTMPFQVSNFAQDDGSYAVADSTKCRVSYIFSPDNTVRMDFEKRIPQGEWNKPVNIADGSQSFWLLQVRSGLCTYGDIIQLAYDDVNCPWEFSIASGAPVSGSSVINFDSRRVSTGTSNTSSYVYMSSGDMSLFPVGTEVAITKADKSAIYFGIVKTNDTVNNRLGFNTLPANPGNACVVTKKVIAEKAVDGNLINTMILPGSTSYLRVSAADYLKFFKSDVLVIKDSTNGWSYTQISSKSIISGNYFLNISPSLPAVPADATVFSLRNFSDAWAFDEFTVPGFFSTDVCARTSEFNPYEDNNTTNKLSSNFTGESDEDKLIRAQNEVHKLFFVWYLEKGGPADNEDYQSFDDLAYNALNPYNYYNGGTFGALNKRNFNIDVLPNIGNKYGTVINLCPNFSLEYPSNYGYGWGGVNTSDGVNPPAFGYVAGATSSEKLQAWAQAVANQINSGLLENYFFNNSWGKRKLPIVAVPFFSNDTGWVVRIKHCFFNNCNKVDDTYWDRANTALLVNQEKENYSPAVPFIKDNALYLKLDRKAITMAIGDKFKETLQFQFNSGPNATTNELYYTQGLNIGSSLYKNLVKANGYNAASPTAINNSNYQTWLKQNPLTLLANYNDGNPMQIFNLIKPLILNTEPGVYASKSGYEPDNFTVVKNPNPLFPDTHLFNIEEVVQNYYFTSTAVDNWDSSETTQQMVYMSVDLAYYLTNFKLYRGPSLSRILAYSYRYGLGSGEYWSELFYNTMYDWVKVDSISAYFRDSGANLGDLISALCDLYEIDGVDTTAIKALNINGFVKISEDKEFYKVIAPLLQANSIVCFTDKNGVINFARLNLKGAYTKQVHEYECLTFERETVFPSYSSIEITYAENNEDSKNKIENVINPAKDSIFTSLDFKNVAKINSNTLDVLSSEAKELMVQKYTENNDYLDITFGMEFLDLNLNDVLQVISNNETSNWVVVKKELDFNTIKIRLIRGI